MQIHNIIYMNQGRQTVLSVYSDDSNIVSFGTSRSIGNQHINSGQLGKAVIVPRGNHSIKVHVDHTDEYGIDISAVTVILVANVEKDSCPTVNTDVNNNSNTKDLVVIICTPIGTFITVIALIVSIVAICFAYYKFKYKNYSSVK